MFSTGSVFSFAPAITALTLLAACQSGTVSIDETERVELSATVVDRPLASS